MRSRGWPTRAVAGLVLAALALAMASCADDEGDVAPGRADAPSARPSRPATGATATTSAPAAPDTQAARPRGPSDLVLVDVRAARHRGGGRLVLEFTGTGRPGWAVGYVDRPVADGSGHRVDVEGDAFLDVYASGTTYPATPSDGYDGPRTFVPGRSAGRAGVAGVGVVGTFEGVTQVVLGLSGPERGFDVRRLADPARLVVDVAPPSR